VSEIDVTGSFHLDAGPHRIGDPIPLVFRVCDTGSDPIFVFVPTGRADGVRITPVSDYALELATMEREPEPGLVGELRLEPGECHEQSYALGDWIDRGAPGTHRLECTIELEVAQESIRAPDTRETPRRVAFTETVELTLQEAGS
jgi:hypothetical protein